MALTQGYAPARRGTPVNGEFGYPVAAGEKVFRGGLLALTNAGTLVRVGNGAAVAFAGLSGADYDNSASAAVSPVAIEIKKGIYPLAVPSATTANVNAAVYATDDNTLTLTNTGALLQVGTLAGIENGQTYVKLI